MENIITTQQAFQLVKLIAVMKIKNEVLFMVKEVSRLETKKKEVMKKLLKNKKDDAEINNDLVIQLFSDNPELAEEYSEIESKYDEVIASFAIDFIFALGEHENQFYKSMSVIFDKDIEEIKKEDITVTVKSLIDLFKSSQFMGFFKSMMK